MITRFLTTCGVVLLAVLLLSSAANATVTGVCANDNPGQCSKSLTLGAINPADLTHRLLTVVLTNTGGSAANGLITGDAFNLPGAVTPVVASFTSTNANFHLFIGPIAVNGGEVPGGDREFSFALDANWEGGGSPNGGIPSPGGAATFTVNLTGSAGDIAALTETAIFTSEAIRIRGAADNLGGSDKDLVTPGTVPNVPEPSTLLLIGTGLIGLGSGAFRKLRRRS